MTYKKYKISGMDCDACAKMIELDLEDTGIKASCNYAKQTLEVELSDEILEKKLLETVEKGGYQITSE